MLDLASIPRLLPHRFPMLLVDRVLAFEPSRSLRAVKAVSVAEHCYRGIDHTDPAVRYDYPVSLLVESACQVGSLLCLASRAPAGLRAGEVLLFAALGNLRVRGRVLPGDVVEHEAKLRSLASTKAVVAVRGAVDGRPVVEIDSLVLAFRTDGSVTAAAPLDSRS